MDFSSLFLRIIQIVGHIFYWIYFLLFNLSLTYFQLLKTKDYCTSYAILFINLTTLLDSLGVNLRFLRISQKTPSKMRNLSYFPSFCSTIIYANCFLQLIILQNQCLRRLLLLLLFNGARDI